METIREQTMNKDLGKESKIGIMCATARELAHICPLCRSGKRMNVQCIRFITVQ